MTAPMTLSRAEEILGTILSAAATGERKIKRGNFFGSEKQDDGTIVGSYCAIGLGLIYQGITPAQFRNFDGSTETFAAHYGCSEAFAGGVSSGFEGFEGFEGYSPVVDPDFLLGLQVGEIIAEITLHDGGGV